jgi:hypothetical protein
MDSGIIPAPIRFTFSRDEIIFPRNLLNGLGVGLPLPAVISGSVIPKTSLMFGTEKEPYEMALSEAI